MSGSILSGPGIRKAVEDGHISIDPFEPKHINPASIDLRLGDEVRIYRDWVDDSSFFIMGGLEVVKEVSFDGSGLCRNPHPEFVQDVREEPRTRSFKMDRKKGWILYPGILYLMHTLETVHSDHVVPVLDGKSSIGRLGIQVHVTAGFGDPGYDGQYTLEVTTVHPIRIYPGMRFCQMRFHSLEGDRLNYRDTGHYKDDAAHGAVGSMAFTQFRE